jgi:PAS domain S-box-containing protein
LALQPLNVTPENLARILDNLKEGIIAHDLERRILFFNREAERITGYGRTEVLGKDCHDAFGAPFCGEHCRFCGPPPKPHLDQNGYLLTITSKSGERHRIEMTQTMMTEAGGRAFGVLAAFRDLSDLACLGVQAEKLTSFANIIGRSNKMLRIYQQIRNVANYDYPVNISGETGTGKELVASAIHSESCRGGAPFVPINCGALPESLIESELFGHVKGAFSGAIRDKKGRFELADGGSVFLDEVAELSKHMQVRLLRFLQAGTFEKVGGEKTSRVNVRIICATNKNLKQEVKRGRFRDDLFYRLNVIPIHLPPLRERQNDIPLLVEHFLRKAAERYGREPLKVSSEALAQMAAYRWPGNVRELQNAIQFAFVRCTGPVIRPYDLPLEIREFQSTALSRGPGRKLDTTTVAAMLKKTGGNKARAAKLLGVGRATLYRFLTAQPEAAAGEPGD